MLAAALIALVLPAFAAAELFTVDTNNDEAKSAAGAECETAFGQCSLRAAVEAADAGSSFDVIDLPSPPFDGALGANSEIQLGSTLEITQPVTIVGHPVFGGPFVTPNVAVTGPAGAATFTVKSNAVTIEDIAIGGGKYGIEVPGAFTGLKAKGNWFGLFLNGSSSPIAQSGILLGPGADEATIGGTEEGERNVFANANIGIAIEGASQTKVQGNYIGVGPTGAGTASLETGVQIVDAKGPPVAKAEKNVIGGALTAVEAAKGECVGPCNVIATQNGLGIDLAGDLGDPVTAASGPTTISGNYIGLAAGGATPVGDNTYGVFAAPTEATCAGGPGDVTIGGVESGATNFFAGGIVSVFAEAANNLSVVGNAIGTGPDGVASSSPQATAIELCNVGVTEPALVAGNRMGLSVDAVGIDSVGGRSQIVGNSILGGKEGIHTSEAGTGTGNLIANNTITEPDTQGIHIEDNSNVVTGNTITKAGRSGILIETDADHNRIGGDGPGEANTIVGTIGPEEEDAAITIFGRETGRNEIAANTGFGNPGAFIKLLPHGGAEKPNGGIQPPILATVRQSSAAGTAKANATVRIFSKASAEPGELGALLAVVKADGAGAWSATYAKLAAGILVTATQTSDAGTAEAGTSVLAAPTAATADPVPPQEPKGGSSGAPVISPPISSPPVLKAPKVKITSGPKKSSTATTARFKFKAEPATGAKFECKLDGAKWARCTSPKTYKQLKVGKHTFRVRAIASGLTGTATLFKFTVTS